MVVLHQPAMIQISMVWVRINFGVLTMDVSDYSFHRYNSLSPVLPKIVHIEHQIVGISPISAYQVAWLDWWLALDAEMLMFLKCSWTQLF